MTSRSKTLDMSVLSNWFSTQPKPVRIRLGLTAVGVVVVFGVVFSQGQNQSLNAMPTGSQKSDSSVDPLPVTSSEFSALHVHVVGEVLRPGLYQLDFGSRVSDAIGAAGGFTELALQTSVNLARQLTDGEQLVVFSTETEAENGNGGLVSLNRASATELDSLPGIGPALADRIIAYRTETGGFSSVTQLQEVSGIGDKVFAEIEPLVTL